MEHAWRVGEKTCTFFSPDNLKHSGDFGLGVRILLKYALAIYEQGKR